MDKDKLDALRRKYATAKGGANFDPEFTAVGKQLFGNSARRKGPFSDPVTFLGPRAVRNVERIRPYEHALRIAPVAHLDFADVGDVPMQSRFSLEQCRADIERKMRTMGSG